MYHVCSVARHCCCMCVHNVDNPAVHSTDSPVKASANPCKQVQSRLSHAHRTVWSVRTRLSKCSCKWLQIQAWTNGSQRLRSSFTGHLNRSRLSLKQCKRSSWSWNSKESFDDDALLKESNFCTTVNHGKLHSAECFKITICNREKTEALSSNS